MTEFLCELEERVGDVITTYRFTKVSDMVIWCAKYEAAEEPPAPPTFKEVVMDDKYFLSEKVEEEFKLIADHIMSLHLKGGRNGL